jgi:hypothetical protein
VRSWARAAGVEFLELSQTGVVRRLVSRNGWNRFWEARMQAKMAPSPRSSGLGQPPASNAPCLALSHGMDLDAVAVNPAGFRAAYRMDDDGRNPDEPRRIFVWECAATWGRARIARSMALPQASPD